MSDRIALAEIPEHIPHLPESARIIALSPAVELELDRTGRDYTRIEDFFDPLDDEKIGMENYPRMETFCTRLDEILRDHIPEIERHNLRPAWWSLYWIKILLDVFFIRGFALERLLDRLQPSEVTYFERTPSGENPVWMDETESTYAVLLDHILPLRNVTAHRLDAFEADKPIPPPTHRQLSTRIRDSLRYRWKMARTFINQRFSRDKKHRLLCLDDRYSLPGILRELEKQDCAYWVWNDENTIKRDGFIPALTLTGTRILSEEEVTRVTNEFQNDHTIRDCLKFGGIDFLDIFIPRLREFTRRIVPETIDYYTNAVHALDELRPHAVLVSKIQFLREKAITEAAHHHDVPVITSRHGELFLRGSPYHRFGESESADWILCWGTWEARWIHRYRTYPAQTPVTGSPMIESSVKDALPRTVIRKQLGFLPTDRIALYAPTSLGGNIWYMGGRQPNDSDYFHQGQRLIQSLLQLEDCHQGTPQRH